MDAIDRMLVGELLRDARTTYQDLGRAVRLSPNTVADRVRRLRSSGLISGYHAHVDLARLGRSLRLLSDVRLKDGVDRGEFERGLRDIEQIVGARRLTGQYDFLLDVACADAAEFETVIDRLKRDHGVHEAHSRLVLHEVELGVDRLLGAGGKPRRSRRTK